MAKQAEPEVGRIVDGKYRLTRLIGRGGMGSVWEGVHTTLGTRFALKYIDTAFAGRKDVQARFANEALAAARLKSKHIVEVYDHGIDEQGCPYIVMEYLSGEPLDAKLGRDGTLSLREATEIVVQASKALSRAHGAGIVHRDLKPENVFLVWDEEDGKTVVKIVDFGIAKFNDGTGIDSATRTGAVLGTPHFMSPEQARGLKSVDFAADVWSLGVITYRAVTGRAPFEGEAVGDLLVKICTVEPTPPSDIVDVPPAFDAWVAKSLAKDASLRFSSVQSQAEALAAIVGVDMAKSVNLAAPLSASSSRAVTAQGSRTDTEGGVERTRTPKAPGALRLWWFAPPIVVVAAAGMWFLGLGRPSGVNPDGELAASAVAGQGAAPSTPPLVVAEPSGAEPSALPGARASSVPAGNSIASAHADAGAAKPGVSVGRPADSLGNEAQNGDEKLSPRRKDPRPPPARPTPRPPKDELGY